MFTIKASRLFEFIPSLSGGGFFVPARERADDVADRAPRESKRRPSFVQVDADGIAVASTAEQVVRWHGAHAARATPRPAAGGPPGEGQDLAARQAATRATVQGPVGLPDAAWALVAAYCEPRLQGVWTVLGKLLAADCLPPAFLEATLNKPETLNLILSANPLLVLDLDRKDQTRERLIRVVRHDPDRGHLLNGFHLAEEEYEQLVVDRGMALKWVPESLRSEAMYAAHVARVPYGILGVPSGARTLAVCRAAVRFDPNSLGYVPKQLRGELEIMAAAMSSPHAKDYPLPCSAEPASLWHSLVSINGLALRHAPASLVDEALCEAAVRQNPGAVAFVPRELRTAPMWKSPHLPVEDLVEQVPPEARTPDQWRKLITHDHQNALRLTPDMQDAGQLVLEACLEHPDLLRRLPPAFKNKPLCRQVLEHRPEALRHLGAEELDQVMCDGAVARDPALFDAVPDPFKSLVMCRAALSRDPLSIRHVPARRLTEALCIRVVWAAPRAIELIPHASQTEAVIAAAVRADYRVTRHIEADRLTPMVLNAAAASCIETGGRDALRRDSATRGAIAERFGAGDNSVCHPSMARVLERLIEAGAVRLEQVPERWRNAQLCEAAMRLDPTSLEAVPKALRTPQLLGLAVQSADEAGRDVPLRLRPKAWFARATDGKKK